MEGTETIVTRVAYSKHLTGRKFAELSELARRLGRLRHELWDRYGSAQGYAASGLMQKNIDS